MSFKPSIFLLLVSLAIVSFFSLFYLNQEHKNTPAVQEEKKILYDKVQRYVNDLENKINQLEQKSLTEKENKKHKEESNQNEIFNEQRINNEQFNIKEEKLDKELDIFKSFHKISSSQSFTNDSIADYSSKEVSEKWRSQFINKLKCLRFRKGALYLYHVRKAAGTTIREILNQVAKLWHVDYYETEGISLNLDFQKLNGIFTVTTMRNPINRIVSLYWYEHVGWYDGVLKQTSRCKTFKEWVDAWRDGSEWKQNFISKNPRNVYVEIENYYVKMLSGWTGEKEVDEEDLEKAKKVLNNFDVILLTEWMSDETQVNAIHALFPSHARAANRRMVKGDKKAKERLKDSLAPDEDSIIEELISINELDLKLWEYVQSLSAFRLRQIEELVIESKRQLGLSEHRNVLRVDQSSQEALHQCSLLHSGLTTQQKKQSIGVFQPPGHKGPF